MKKLLYIFLFFSSSLLAQNLIPNGDFELGPDSSSAGWLSWVDSTCIIVVPVSGPDLWSVVSFSPDRIVQGNNFCGHIDTAQSGISFVDFWGGESGKATLLAPVIQDSIYNFSCYLKRIPFSSGNPANITFLLSGGDSIFVPNIVNDTSWQYFDTTITASAISNELTVKGSGHSLAGVSVDNMKLEKISSNGIVNYFEKELFKIYPNPTKEIVFIASNNNEKLNVMVSDISGNQISIPISSKNELTTIDFTSCPSGIYFITTQTQKIKLTQKVLVIK